MEVSLESNIFRKEIYQFYLDVQNQREDIRSTFQHYSRQQIYNYEEKLQPFLILVPLSTPICYILVTGRHLALEFQISGMLQMLHKFSKFAYI